MKQIDELYRLSYNLDSSYAREVINKILQDWYVECSVTGELIPFNQMKYWDVDSNMIFKDATTAFNYRNNS